MHSPVLSTVLGLVLASTVSGQEPKVEVAAVITFSGEVLPGEVVGVSGSRVRLKRPDGRTQSLHKRDVKSARTAEGESVDLTVALGPAPLSDADRKRLREVSDFVFAIMSDRELSSLLDDPSVAAYEELSSLAREVKNPRRVAAIWMLARVGAARAIADLVKLAIEDPKAEIRFEAASALQTDHAIRVVGVGDHLATLRRGFEDKEGKTRFGLARIAARLGDAAARPVLKDGLANSDHHVRESCALSLAELGDESGMSHLLKMVKRKGEEFRIERVAVCRALGRLGSRRAKGTLKTVARDDDAVVAKAATEALALIEAAAK